MCKGQLSGDPKNRINTLDDAGDQTRFRLDPGTRTENKSAAHQPRKTSNARKWRSRAPQTASGGSGPGIRSPAQISKSLWTRLICLLQCLVAQKNRILGDFLGEERLVSTSHPLLLSTILNSEERGNASTLGDISGPSTELLL